MISKNYSYSWKPEGSSYEVMRHNMSTGKTELWLRIHFYKIRDIYQQNQTNYLSVYLEMYCRSGSNYNRIDENTLFSILLHFNQSMKAFTGEDFFI